MTDTLPGATYKVTKEEIAEAERFSRNIFSAFALARRMNQLEVSMPNASVSERLRVFYREYPPEPR